MLGGTAKKARSTLVASPKADAILNGFAIVGSIVLCVVPLAIIGGYVLEKWALDARRHKVERAAFGPIEELGGTATCLFLEFETLNMEIWCVFVEFPETSLLDDTTISQLSSLNALPEGRSVDLTIRTQNVTDASLSSLELLPSLRRLDVTDTAISDDGLKSLAAALPDSQVVLRERTIRTPRIRPQRSHRRSGYR